MSGMTWKLEMRNTEDWADVRWRSFTQSKKRAEAFRNIPKMQFSDSGHGMVAVVEEVRGKKGGRREPDVRILKEHVNAYWSW